MKECKNPDCMVQFVPNSNSQKFHSVECRDKYYAKSQARKDTMKKYWQTDKGKLVQANASLKHKSGITLSEKEAMYKKQKGLCKLCGKLLPKDYRKSHADHNHETKVVRGLLHSFCNTFLGYLEQRKYLLAPAFEYLGWTFKEIQDAKAPSS